MTRRDCGAATAELAAALPALVVVLLASLTAISAVLTKLECVDAARDAALVAARGGDGVAAGAAAGPAGATVRITADGDTIRAVVSGRVQPLGGRLPAFGVSATALAEAEPAGLS